MSKRTTPPDLQFTNLGFAVQCVPETDLGADWLAENLNEPVSHNGSAVFIEHRYLEGLVTGARAAGLVCHG